MIEAAHLGLVRSEFATEVISPGYDSLGPEERDAYVKTHPLSYLNVNRSAPRGAGHPSEHRRLAYEGADALRRLKEENVFDSGAGPRMLVQQIDDGVNRQVAVVGTVSSDTAERLRPHELTYSGRVRALSEHLEATKTMSSPVMVTARPGAFDLELVRSALDELPLLDVVLRDGARLRVFDLGPTSLAVDGDLYILDGHHRSAAADLAGLDRLLVALVPAEMVYVRSFDRIIDGLTVMPRRVLEETRAMFDVEPVATITEARPTTAGTVGLGIDGAFYRLRRRGQIGLDADVVQQCLLGDVLGIHEPNDPSVRYRPAGAGGSDGDVLVMLAPLAVDTILDTADRDEVLPPKSTYITPKLRSGVYVARC
jgi:uncharacterized protein (DUF1015 family)